MTKEEEIIREYFEPIYDINGTETIDVLPLSMVDMLLEYEEIVKNLTISDVSGSYNIDFDGHCLAKLQIKNGVPKIEAAINGWGNDINIGGIKIKKL